MNYWDAILERAEKKESLISAYEKKHGICTHGWFMPEKQGFICKLCGKFFQTYDDAYSEYLRLRAIATKR